MNLKVIVSTVFLEKQPRTLFVLSLNVAKSRFNRISAPQVSPILRREVIEGQHDFPIFLQTLGGLGIFGAIGLYKMIKRVQCLGFGFSNPYVMQYALRFSLCTLVKFIEDVSGLVYSIPLLLGGRTNLPQSSPESHCAVPYCHLRPLAKLTAFLFSTCPTLFIGELIIL